MASSRMLRHVALVRTDVSEELCASIIRVARIGELGTTLVVTSNRRCQIPPKRRFLQEPHGVTSQKTPFFNVNSVWKETGFVIRVTLLKLIFGLIHKHVDDLERNPRFRLCVIGLLTITLIVQDVELHSRRPVSCKCDPLSCFAA
jgi:hypothetical protein